MNIETVFRELLREELEFQKAEILESIERSQEKSRYMTRKEVAKYLSIGLSTVDYWSGIGKLEKIEISGTVRFDKNQIDQLLNQKK